MATQEAIDLRGLVDRRLDELLESEMGRLAFLAEEEDRETLRHHLVEFVRTGGKRLRPAFVYWGHRAAGGSPADRDAVLAAGCAVELLHASAMILDDVMDESATRRGRTTAHVALADRHRRSGWWGDPARYGESVATLLGMLAFTWADAALLSSGGAVEALKVFTQLRVEIIAGQYLDLAYAARGVDGVEAATRVSIYKSGKYTVERPLHLGHAIAAGDPALKDVLSAYALPLGEAFQLRDDVLGVFGDPARTGKPAGTDLRQGKRTYLTAETRERAGKRLPLLDGIHDEADVARARELIVTTGALDAVERRIAALVAVAVEALDDDRVPEDARQALRELAGTATSRTS
ncbi:polyprenyl synthetase family protein [Sphaerisporangium sp. B11E5]